MSAYQVRLNIDGVYMGFYAVDFLYQEKPFPGGHFYKLKIFDIDTKKHLWKMSLGEHRNVDSSIFLRVQMMVLSLKEQLEISETDEESTGFFINTIETLILSSDEIYLEGICSKLIKDP